MLSFEKVSNCRLGRTCRLQRQPTRDMDTSSIDRASRPLCDETSENVRLVRTISCDHIVEQFIMKEEFHELAARTEIWDKIGVMFY